jgi:hypothetical protein
MKPIKIDVEAVPENKRTHPDFLGLLNSMTVGMADPANVFSVCIHEAGHMFFSLELQMEFLGMDGPQIIYVAPDQFQGCPLRANIKAARNTVEQIAIMLSAGGIFSSELDNNRLGLGDSEDREIFNLTCRNAGLTDTALIESAWKVGQAVVRKRLQDPTFRENMKELARRMMAELQEKGAFS